VVLPLGRHASIRGSRSIHAPSASLLLIQEEQNARHHNQFKREQALAPDGLRRLAAIDPDSLSAVEGNYRFGIPYSGISKYICIGLNYSDHAAESGLAVPSEPTIFVKAISALCGPNDDTVQPLGSTKLDWEVELGVAIGTKAQYVSEAEALSYVAGDCLVNDVSERSFQMQSSQWIKGKGCDTFGPIRPWLVTADEIPDPQALPMWRDANGRRMQTGNTKTMSFSVKTLASCQPLYNPNARRRYRDRHAARRGYGYQAGAGLPDAGRYGPPRHRGPCEKTQCIIPHPCVP